MSGLGGEAERRIWVGSVDKVKVPITRILTSPWLVGSLYMAHRGQLIKGWKLKLGSLLLICIIDTFIQADMLHQVSQFQTAV